MSDAITFTLIIGAIVAVLESILIIAGLHSILDAVEPWALILINMGGLAGLVKLIPYVIALFDEEELD